MTDTLWIAGTQEDTATVDLGILSTSQRSDPLLRTTSSTVNSLWAGKRNEKNERKKKRGPQAMDNGGRERKRRAQHGSLLPEGCGAAKRHTRDDGPL